LEYAMNGMPLHIGWNDIALRLALTVVAGLLIGHNRTEHGKAAGMRTTLLTCLAASIAMIQMNLLLPTAGRSPDSFIMNDLMRLPLGILTGVGFIGGGVILRRHDIEPSPRRSDPPGPSSAALRPRSCSPATSSASTPCCYAAST